MPRHDSPAEISESEEEGHKDYRRGGYHVVRIGESYKSGRYLVCRKLGWGQSSTVWLSWDNVDKRYVALKIQKSAHDYTEAALDEITILRHIRTEDPDDCQGVVKLLDHFKHRGPNGHHVCMVLEYLGDNLLSLIKHYKYRGLPVNMVRQLASHILVGLHFLHSQMSIIHTDLKPENVILQSPLDPVKDPPNLDSLQSNVRVGWRSNLNSTLGEEKGCEEDLTSRKKRRKKTMHNISRKAGRQNRQSGPWSSRTAKDVSVEVPRSDFHLLTCQIEDDRNLKCKIVDLGNACWSYKQITDDIQTREYRCPEAILGAKYSYSADMWSFACIVFELATGDVLFATRKDRDEDHLDLMMELLGPMPRKIALGGRYSRDYFNRHGKLRGNHKERPWPMDRVLVEKYGFPVDSAQQLAAFLCPFLDYNPERRPTAGQSLQHPWLNVAPSTAHPSLVSDRGDHFPERSSNSADAVRRWTD